MKERRRRRRRINAALSTGPATWSGSNEDADSAAIVDKLRGTADEAELIKLDNHYITHSRDST